jgi:hypothetical protein
VGREGDHMQRYPVISEREGNTFSLILLKKHIKLLKYGQGMEIKHGDAPWACSLGTQDKHT